MFYRKQSKNSITQQPGDWCVQTQSNTERIMTEHVKWSPKNWYSLKHPLHNRGISSRSLLHVVYSLLFLLRLKSIQSEFKVLFMVNITSYQSLGRIVKRGIAIDVGGRTGRRGINPVIYGFAVLNIDRLHLRDENFVFIFLFPIAKNNARTLTYQLICF